MRSMHHRNAFAIEVVNDALHGHIGEEHLRFQPELLEVRADHLDGITMLLGSQPDIDADVGLVEAEQIRLDPIPIARVDEVTAQTLQQCLKVRWRIICYSRSCV